MFSVCACCRSWVEGFRITQLGCMAINKEAKELILLPVLRFQGPYTVCLLLSGPSGACPLYVQSFQLEEAMPGKNGAISS